LKIKELIISTMKREIAESQIGARIALILLFSLPLLLLPAAAYDFTGTVVKVSEPNSMTVNITQAGTYGLQAKVEVLLDKPLANLASFKGKELQFEILGRDILGRPVCEAYLNGISIRNVYDGWQPLIDYGYRPSYYYGWEWGGKYDGTYYIPCFGQCRSYYYPYF
jgi:hypothetical protein